MAQQTLDKTGNESMDTTIGKIQSNFDELYGANVEFTDWSGVSVTASGAITGGSVTTAGKITGGSLVLDTGTKTATATTGAATLNKDSGLITSEALTTAAAAEYTLTLTNSSVAAGDYVFASVQNGSNTVGPIYVTTITPGSGSVVIKVINGHATAPLDGTIKIAFLVVKAS